MIVAPRSAARAISAWRRSGEHHAGGRMVRRRQHGGTGVARGERLDDDATLVDRHRDGLEPGHRRAAEHVTVFRILKRHPPFRPTQQRTARRAIG